MIPLCVDLDGTLVKSDTSFESFLLILKKNPCYLFLILFWLCKGRAHLKQQLAKKVAPDPEHLPYTQSFLTFLREEFNKGRKLILVTGANYSTAAKISAYLKIFSSVLASNESMNLTGHNKCQALTAQFGAKAYDYAGNSVIDLPVWQQARKALVVNATTSVLKKAQQSANVSQVFASKNNHLKHFLKAIRIHQYVKNLLLFIPLFVGHRDFSLSLLASSMLAFCCFCLISSSIYLFNDLLDIEADRKHTTKKYRAFAAGELSIVNGFIFILIFFAMGIFFSLSLSIYFTAALVSYYFIGIIYSFYFKRVFLLDVLVLAVLYTIRIIAGMAVVGAGYSDWLLLFALFFFLSLAFVKRYSELYDAQQETKIKLAGRNYSVTDIKKIAWLGKISGYLSVLTLAFYISTERAKFLYAYPKLLWLVCLLLFIWIFRVWLLAGKGCIRQDPVIFALKDKTSLTIGLMTTCLVLIATFW